MKQKLSTQQLQNFCSITRDRINAKCVICIVVDEKGVLCATSAAQSDFTPQRVVDTLEKMTKILRTELP